ncbi:MAG: hypothetical protein WAT46_04175, partial [Saprospiraceae bacterium]
MMRNYLSTFLMVNLVLTSVLLQAQNALVPDILPSANAQALGKYGDFPVSHYTGQANVSIPIYSNNINDIALNINLQYDGTGIMVNNHGGWVGQNWTLETGGVITRSVQGVADEIGKFMGSDYFNLNNSYFDVVAAGNYLTYDNTDTYEDLKIMAQNKLSTRYSDTEPDIFSFNLMGMSGKFYFDQNGDWKVISDQNISVEFDVADVNNYQSPFIEIMPYSIPQKLFEKVIKGFKLKDDRGNTYTFGHNEDAIEYSIPFFNHFQTCDLNVYPNWIANSWYLTKVEDYLGNDVYKLSYERGYFTAQTYESRSYKKEYCYLPLGIGWINSVSYNNISATGSLTSPVYLRNIVTNRGDSISFDISNVIEKKMDFTPVHHSVLGDINSELQLCGGWPSLNPLLPFLQQTGYYSFSPSAALINPFEGLMWKKLDRISMYSANEELNKNYEFEYNNNVNERLKLVKFKVTTDDYASNPNAPTYDYIFDYDMFSSLPAYPTKKIDHWGYYKGVDYYLSPSGNIQDELLYHYNSRESDLNYAKIGMLKSMIVPTKGKTEFDYELHDYSNVVSADRQTLGIESGVTGGLRIKEIRNYDSDGVTLLTRKEYKYVNNYQNGGATSSGILALKPRYVWKDWLHPTDEYPSGGYKEDIFSTNILIPLGNLFESHIGYKEVVELEQDDSYTKYTYTSHDDVKDEIPYGYLGLQYSHFDKFSDKSYYRGRIKTMEDYNATNNIQKRVSYIYNGAIVPPLSFGENYGITFDVSFGYKCDSQQDRYYKGSARKIFHFRYLMDMVTATYYFGNDQVQTQTNNQYARPIFASNKYAFLMQKSITNSDGKVYMDYYKYPFDHTSSYPGQQTLINQLKDQHR